MSISIKHMRRLAGIDSNYPHVEEAKDKTYAQAQADILTYLTQNKWSVKSGLKIPYATSPDGQLRLWFKTQSVYFTTGDKHQYADARTVDYSHDIRKMDGPSFEKYMLDNQAARKAMK